MSIFTKVGGKLTGVEAGTKRIGKYLFWGLVISTIIMGLFWKCVK